MQLRYFNPDTLIYVDIYFVIAGAVVGFIVGLTGVGGGSLMTPLLVMGFGIQPSIAVGTDLLYASITKAGGVLSHAKRGNIEWPVVLRMASGSIPCSLLTIALFSLLEIDSKQFDHLISITLGIMLIFTSVVVLWRHRLSHLGEHRWVTQHQQAITVLSGALLGVMVTLSSVGAGAIGTAILFMVYPTLLTRRVVGTDLAHAVPLTAIAGLGHWHLGHVDFSLLVSLLIGSLPGIYLGSHVGEKMPEKLLRPLVATILFGVGVKFAV